MAKARRKSGGDVRPRFAGIHADQRVRCLMFLVEINAHRPADRMKSRIIEWRRAGDTPNAVSAKILFCHKGVGEPLGSRPAKILAQRRNQPPPADSSLHTKHLTTP